MIVKHFKLSKHNDEAAYCAAFKEHRIKSAVSKKSASVKNFFHPSLRPGEDPNAKRAKREQYSYNDPVQKEFESALIELIEGKQLAYAILDSPLFHRVIEIANANLMVPSSYRMTQRLIPNKKQELMDQTIIPALESAAEIALSTDSGKSVKRDKLYTINMHVINPSTAELLTFNIATTPIPNGEDHVEIAAHLDTQLEVLPVAVKSKILHGVTDRAPSMLAAMRVHDRTTAMCNVHMLSTCVKTAVSKCMSVGNAQAWVNTFVNNVRAHRAQQKELDRLQVEDTRGKAPLQLIPLIDTRFVYFSISLARVIKLKKSIRRLEHCTLDAKQWCFLEHLDRILAPFFLATVSLSAYARPTLPLVVPIIYFLQHHLKKMQKAAAEDMLLEGRDDIVDFIAQLKTQLETLWNYSNKVRLVGEHDDRRLNNQLIASLLHPLAKDLEFSKGVKSASRLLETFCVKIAADRYSKEHPEEPMSVDNEVSAESDFLDSQPIRKEAKSDPLQIVIESSKQAVKAYLAAKFDVAEYLPPAKPRKPSVGETAATEPISPDVFEDQPLSDDQRLYLFDLAKFWNKEKSQHPLIFDVRGYYSITTRIIALAL